MDPNALQTGLAASSITTTQAEVDNYVAQQLDEQKAHHRAEAEVKLNEMAESYATDRRKWEEALATERRQWELTRTAEAEERARRDAAFQDSSLSKCSLFHPSSEYPLTVDYVGF